MIPFHVPWYQHFEAKAALTCNKQSKAGARLLATLRASYRSTTGAQATQPKYYY